MADKPGTTFTGDEQLSYVSSQLDASNSSTMQLVEGFEKAKASVEDLIEQVKQLSTLPLVQDKEIQKIDQLIRKFKEVDSLKKKQGEKTNKQVSAYKAIEILVGNIAKNIKVSERDMEGLAHKWTNVRGTVSAVARSATGIDLSLTGIVMELIKVYNLSNKISGMAGTFAGGMGRSSKSIMAASDGIFDLYSNLNVTYDEAGSVIETLSRLGFSAEQISAGGRKRIAQYNVSNQLLQEEASAAEKISKTERRRFESEDSVTSALNEQAKVVRSIESDLSRSGGSYQDPRYQAELDRYVELGEQRSALAKEEKKLTDDLVSSKRKINREEAEYLEKAKKVAEQNAKAAAFASELRAIQQRYGLSVEQSGTAIKNMQANLGKTFEESKATYGAVLMTFEKMKLKGDMPYGMSAAEMVGDWQKLTALAQVFKMDLLGILSSYQVLIRDGEKIGLGDDVSADVKKELMTSLVDAPTKMSYGMKAALSESSGPGASRALDFEREAEKNGPLYVMKRAMDFVDKKLGKVPVGMSKEQSDQQEFKTRQLLEQMSLPANAVKELSRARVSGKLTGGNIDKLMEKQAKEYKKIEDNKKIWEEQKGTIIRDAGQDIAKMRSVEERIRQWLQTELMGVVTAIRDAVQMLAHQAGAPSSVLAREGVTSDLKDKLADLNVRDVSSSALEKVTARITDRRVNKDYGKIQSEEINRIAISPGFGFRSKGDSTAQKANRLVAEAKANTEEILLDRAKDRLSNTDAAGARKIALALRAGMYDAVAEYLMTGKALPEARPNGKRPSPYDKQEKSGGT